MKRNNIYIYFFWWKIIIYNKTDIISIIIFPHTVRIFETPPVSIHPQLEKVREIESVMDAWLPTVEEGEEEADIDMAIGEGRRINAEHVLTLFSS